MAKVTGVVEKLSSNFGKFGMLVNGKWHNTNPEWLKVKPNEGDTVEFDDGDRNYIKNLRVVSGGTGAAPAAAGSAPKAGGYGGGRTFPVAPTAPERTINRQNALTNAVSFLGKDPKKVVSPDEVIEVARMFEAYTTGDLDAAEAEAALAEMGA